MLGNHGGVWITPDFSLKADAENISAQQRRFRRVVATATDRTMYNNAFDDIEHVTAYFGARGFQVEVVSQSYLAPNLTSPERVHLRPGLWEELKPRQRLWVLKRARRVHVLSAFGAKSYRSVILSGAIRQKLVFPGG